MNNIIYVLIIFGILAGLFYYGFTHSQQVEKIAQTGNDVVREIVSKTPAGDSITLYLRQQTIEEQVISDMEEQKQQYNSTNSTAPQLTGKSVSVTRDMTKIYNTVSVDNKLIVQKGNYALIEGKMQVINPDTKKPYELGYIDWNISIECSEAIKFCTLEPLGSRGKTDESGYFTYKWYVTDNMVAGDYNVNVFGRSESIDPETQRKYEMRNSMIIEVVP